jgi:hypothetical protein
MTNSERERVIQDKLDSFGAESFPDDEGVTWHSRGVEHKGDYSFVETEPVPGTVGYPRFKFVLSFKHSSGPAVVGCYCLDKGAWRLLFNDPEAPSDWEAL